MLYSANASALAVLSPDNRGGLALGRAFGHQNFAICNWMDPSLGFIPLTSFGYEVEDIHVNKKKNSTKRYTCKQQIYKLSMKCIHE